MIYGHPRTHHAHRGRGARPAALHAKGFEVCEVHVPTAHAVFPLWKGTPIADTYGGKTVLDAGGKPAFAEQMVLHLLENEGWDAVWVDGFRNINRVGYADEQVVGVIPDRVRAVLSRIAAHAGHEAARPWDVLAWHGDACLFVECKRQGQDRLRSTQREWLTAALLAGIPLTSFVVLEWTVEE